MTPERDSMIAAWIAAIERLRDARHALGQWRTSNPYLDADVLPKDHDKAADAMSRWEQGNDRFATAYGDTVEALVALRAPNMDAAIVKLQLAREALSEGREDNVAPILHAIERDLRWLAEDQEPPN